MTMKAQHFSVPTDGRSFIESKWDNITVSKKKNKLYYTDYYLQETTFLCSSFQLSKKWWKKCDPWYKITGEMVSIFFKCIYVLIYWVKSYLPPTKQSSCFRSRAEPDRVVEKQVKSREITITYIKGTQLIYHFTGSNEKGQVIWLGEDKWNINLLVNDKILIKGKTDKNYTAFNRWSSPRLLEDEWWMWKIWYDILW